VLPQFVAPTAAAAAAAEAADDGMLVVTLPSHAVREATSITTLVFSKKPALVCSPNSNTL